MIYCFGDSLTKGMPGISYISFMDKKHKLKNCGVGGDTILNMTDRLKKKLKKADNLIICIGLNDILHPYFKNYSKSWNVAIKIKERKRFKLSETIENFEDNYIEMIKLIKDKKVLVIGMPLLESNLEVLNAEISNYNTLIKNICKTYDITYIDMEKEEIKYRRNLDYNIKHNWLNTISDAVFTRKQKNVEKLSKDRNLTLTVDGIHFNNVSASLLAKLIEDKIGIFYT